MSITKKEMFRDFNAVGACLMSPSYLCILLQSDTENKDGGVKVRFAVCNLAHFPEQKWGGREFATGWASPKIVHTEFNEYLVVDRVGDVYYCGVGDNKHFESSLTSNKTGVSALKNIGGTVYGVSTCRCVYKRLGPDHWQLEQELRDTYNHQRGNGTGFRDIDGFSQQDLYAVGGDRDVWHFDGENWSPIDIGSRQKFRCNAVCCAEDGYVYIVGEEGNVARGRGEEWKVYYPNDYASAFFSVVSYQGRVFAGTEHSTYLIGEDLAPQVYDFEGQFAPIAGKYLYSAHGKLLVANHWNQVALFDGKKWLNINGCHDITPEEGSMLLGQALDFLEEAQDHLDDLAAIISKSKK